MTRPIALLLPVIAAILFAVGSDTASARVHAQSQIDAGGLVDRPAAGEAETYQSNCTSLSEAIDRVRRQYGGRIISAETIRSGNREVHVIKVLTSDNTVKTVRINGCRLNGRGG